MRKLLFGSVALATLVCLTYAAVAQPPAGPSGRGPGRGFRASTALGPALGKDEAEKKVLATLDSVGSGGRMQNVPAEDGRLLRVLTEAIGAKHVAEIGTSNGYSGLWISLGLLKTGGKLTTFEIDPERVRLARANFREAGVDRIATVVEGDAHEEVTKLKGPIDLVFIDADKEGYPDYLKKLLPLVRPGGLILAHNITMASSEYTCPITTDPNLETLFLPSSFSVTLKKR